jgi:hypothetical protein
VCGIPEKMLEMCETMVLAAMVRLFSQNGVVCRFPWIQLQCRAENAFSAVFEHLSVLVAHFI